MLSFCAYIRVLLSTSVISYIIWILMFTLISVKLCTEMLQVIFEGKRTSEENLEWIFVFQLAVPFACIFIVVHSVLISRCAISMNVIFASQVCSDRPMDCFIFDSALWNSSSKSFARKPGSCDILIYISPFSVVCHEYNYIE